MLGDLELLILLPVPSEFWDNRHVPSYSVCTVLEIEFSDLHMLGKSFANQGTPLAVPNCSYFCTLQQSVWKCASLSLSPVASPPGLHICPFAPAVSVLRVSVAFGCSPQHSPLISSWLLIEPLAEGKHMKAEAFVVYVCHSLRPAASLCFRHCLAYN